MSTTTGSWPTRPPRTTTDRSSPDPLSGRTSMSGKNSPQHQAATGGAEPTPAPDTASGAPETGAELPPTSGESEGGRTAATGTPETAATAEAAPTPPAQPA